MEMRGILSPRVLVKRPFALTRSRLLVSRERPEGKSLVSGFDVSIMRMTKAALITHPEYATAGFSAASHATREHFEVVIHYNGNNPRYPAPPAQWMIWVIPATSGEKSGTVNLHGGLVAVNTGLKKVEILEEYENWRAAQVIDARGNAPVRGPEFVVWAVIHSNTARASAPPIKLGLLSRPVLLP